MPQTFTIAHLSDIHCGDAHFVPDLMERAISDINSLEPDIVVCSGDLTTFGFKEEYARAKSYLDRLQGEGFVIVPGNPDSRTVGSRRGSPPSAPSCASSSSTPTCCRCQAPGGSGTSSTTPATRSSASSA